MALLNTPKRILIVSTTKDEPCEYTCTMNCLFAAKKMNVRVDCLGLEASLSRHLSVLCDETGGQYSTLDESIVERLVNVHLFEQSKEKNLIASTTKSVCMCHGTEQSISWVCGVCLSVWCQKGECWYCNK